MRMDKYVLDSDGNPVVEPELLKWADWYEDANRKIAQTKVGDATVSTVFLGIDYAFNGGPPMIFETLVFGGPLDQEMNRYSTRSEAISGHATMVDRVLKNGTNVAQTSDSQENDRV